MLLCPFRADGRKGDTGLVEVRPVMKDTGQLKPFKDNSSPAALGLNTALLSFLTTSIVSLFILLAVARLGIYP